LKANTEAGLTYQWKKDSTVIATATDSMYIAATTGAFTVITTNLSGCTTTAAPITVTVNARPTPMLRANGNATFCQGDSVRLSIAGGATYLWSTTSMDTSIWVKTSGSYGVTVTNSNGCTAIDSIQVVVNALPMSTLTAGTSATFCQGDSVLLKATSGTNFTYQWLKNGAILSGITASTYRTNTAGSYAAVVRDDNGCSNASPALLVTVNALPSATATASGATTFCKGSNVVMAANAGNRLMYQWMDSTAIIGNATNRTYGTLRTGAFSVMVTDSNGCKSASSVINVTVHNNPSANFTNSIQAGSGSIVDFTNTSSAGTVQWSFGDSLNSTSTQANPTFWYKSNGSYTVKLVVTNANGCADSTSTMITVTRVRTSNQELATALDVKVFPNPFSEQMTVKIENTTVELGNNDRLIVTNGLGQIVHQSVLNQKIIELNTQDWATGIYNLTIYTKGQMIPIKKMVKI
jgi:PKD repeat protein